MKVIEGIFNSKSCVWTHTNWPTFHQLQQHIHLSFFYCCMYSAHETVCFWNRSYIIWMIIGLMHPLISIFCLINMPETVAHNEPLNLSYFNEIDNFKSEINNLNEIFIQMECVFKQEHLFSGKGNSIVLQRSIWSTMMISFTNFCYWHLTESNQSGICHPQKFIVLRKVPKGYMEFAILYHKQVTFFLTRLWM